MVILNSFLLFLCTQINPLSILWLFILVLRVGAQYSSMMRCWLFTELIHDVYLQYAQIQSCKNHDMRTQTWPTSLSTEHKLDSLSFFFTTNLLLIYTSAFAWMEATKMKSSFLVRYSCSNVNSIYTSVLCNYCLTDISNIFILICFTWTLIHFGNHLKFVFFHIRTHTVQTLFFRDSVCSVVINLYGFSW